MTAWFYRVLAAFAAVMLGTTSLAQSYTPSVGGYAPPIVNTTCRTDGSNKCDAISLTNPMPVTVVSGGGAGGSVSQYAQGSTTSGQIGDLTLCTVVSGNQTYTVGTSQPCNITATGRLKVGLSSTGNVAPAPLAATTLESVLTGCLYRSAGAVYADQYNGAIACDVSGNLLVNSASDNITQVGGVSLTLGQKANAASIPVTLSSDGNQATATLQNAGNASLTTIAGAVSTAGSAAVTTGVVSMLRDSTGLAQQVRDVFTANASSGLGIPAAGVLGAVNSTPPAYGSGVYAALQTDPRGSLRVIPVGNQLAINGISPLPMGFQSTGSQSYGFTLGVAQYLYNGSTFDMAKGDATGGTVVQMGLGATALGGTGSTTVYASTANTFKATAGNLSSVQVVNSTAAGFLVLTNLAAAPASGTAITAASNAYCMPVAASLGFDKTFGVPLYFSAGITALFSTSCTTYTPVATAPIQITAQIK